MEKEYSEVLRFLPCGSITIVYLKVVAGGRFSILTKWLVFGCSETVKVLFIPEVKIRLVGTLFLVEKEMRT